MKIKSVALDNVSSFKERTVIPFNENTILIGPNGGGKSTLINAIAYALNCCFLQHWEFAPDKKIREGNGNFGQQGIRPHREQKNLLSKITLEIEITKSDIEAFKEFEDSLPTILPTLQEKTEYFNDGRVEHILGLLKDVNVGLTFFMTVQVHGNSNYQVITSDLNGNPMVNEIASAVCNFWKLYSGAKLVDDIQMPHFPFLIFPNLREPSGMTASLSTPGQGLQNVTGYSQQVGGLANHAQTSVGQLSVLSATAMANIFYAMQMEKGTKYAIEEFPNDENIKSLKENLKKFGFDFELIDVGFRAQNEYGVKIIQGNNKFDIQEGSSGERQIMNFIFVLSTLSARNALILIDEPELNLHPRWQNKLLEFLAYIAKKNNNQLLISTHSPSFITPESFEYTARVYKSLNGTSIKRPAASEVSKDILQIINGHNNARIFFADFVVLVEGLSDELFWKKLFHEMQGSEELFPIIEVVSVNGKLNFDKYRKLLNDLNITNFIIADLDYIVDVEKGNNKYFQTNDKKIDEKITESGSLDGKSLIEIIKSYIEGDVKDPAVLSGVVNYIEGRHRKIKPDLSQEDKEVLFTAIDRQKENNIFICRYGDLENYTPSVIAGQNDKIARALAFTLSDVEWKQWYEKNHEPYQAELINIAERIISTRTN